MQNEYITVAKKIQLEEELHYLQNQKRREILSQLEYAKGLGDLSENAEYHDAREAQGKLEDRIRVIEHTLKTALIVDEHAQSDRVRLGSTVTVSRNNEEKTFTLVSAEDADISTGKLSYQSPLGTALMNKKVGDESSIITPKGQATYTITHIA